ncbi:hypothetical protein OJAV_G00232100 [Oryzias javanicus]|uniref:Uncharacterized protein n=1 Tax=Oryzias javanicus TaxID=123683 RepID=A0A437C007_ORYJA|nr:hypothetical protein OJAV_G00232100 [Oryzias javanicus]
MTTVFKSNVSDFRWTELGSSLPFFYTKDSMMTDPVKSRQSLFHSSVKKRSGILRPENTKPSFLVRGFKIPIRTRSTKKSSGPEPPPGLDQLCPRPLSQMQDSMMTDPVKSRQNLFHPGVKKRSGILRPENTKPSFLVRGIKIPIRTRSTKKSSGPEPPPKQSQLCPRPLSQIQTGQHAMQHQRNC